MAVIKRHVNDNFTQVSNKVLRDPDLSLKAKGLLALLLSFDHNWEFKRSHIQTLSTNGKSSHLNVLNEIEEAGYIKREKPRLDDGSYSTMEWHISDQPIFSKDAKGGENRGEKPLSSTARFPSAGNSSAGDPCAGKVRSIRTTTEEHQPKEHQPQQSPTATKAQARDSSRLDADDTQADAKGDTSFAPKAKALLGAYGVEPEHSTFMDVLQERLQQADLSDETKIEYLNDQLIYLTQKGHEPPKVLQMLANKKHIAKWLEIHDNMDDISRSLG